MPDIERVTLENAAEQLKAKIRQGFVELIPEEQWTEMVTTELKRFLNVTTVPPANSWGEAKHLSSGFTTLCQEVFSGYIKEQVKEVLRSPEWQDTWDNKTGRPGISRAIQAWLTEHSPQLIQATVQALAGDAARLVLGNMR